tara:strand:+ start:4325 stop:5020 length:696 start_codon:yes stop_codon:yes gene_type:complete
MHENIYIISDVHGCYKSLLALIDKLPNKEKSKICFVGDLVDRGNNSCDVVKLIMDNNYDCVLGNHEQVFIEHFHMLENDRENPSLSRWLFKTGGEQTVNSYTSKDEFYKQIEFLKKLPLYREYKNYKTNDERYLVVSHSCVGRKWHLRRRENKKEKDLFKIQLLWSRYKNFDNKKIFNVYGHTIFEEPIINEYSCGIDLGCYKRKPRIKNPRLCALEFPSMRIITQENIEL